MAPADTPAALGAPGVTETEWQELALRSGNVFGTLEWLGTWQSHEPTPANTFTMVERHADGRLGALLPLVVHRRRPRVLRPVGPWPPVVGGLICAEEDRNWAVSSLSAQLTGRRDWDVLQMNGVPAEEAWLDELDGVRLGQHPSPVVELHGTSWDELLRSAGSSFRRDVGRRRRRLGERYDVEFRRAGPDTLREDVDALLRLHWARWGDEVNVLTPARTGFLHAFAQQALERDWLQLWTLRLDGRTAAALLDLRFAGREFAYLAGRDLRFDSDYVGLAILFHALEQATVDGVRTFEMLRGDQPYKSRLPHRARLADDLVLSAGWVGTATITAQAARSRLRGRRP